ncbi:MAG TPA: response regulator transcription factor [Bryobacteraceae bacterium]|nr:response regulator transcription factor [Bryobacteraceae bacterium]
MSPRLLLAEDEPALAMVLCDRLEREGYSVVSVHDGISALHTALRTPFDLIVLDVMMPGKNGFEVCRDLRAQGSTVPILMLTARSEVRDRVTGLKSGADDYLPKPFDTSELLARIEALLRRAKGTSAGTAAVYEFGAVKVNTRRREVTRDGELVTLSAKEYQLLCYLLERPNAVVSRDELLEQVWGYRAATNTRTVDVHLGQLRGKLEEDAKQPRYLLTVHGSGYRFVKDS